MDSRPRSSIPSGSTSKANVSKSREKSGKAQGAGDCYTPSSSSHTKYIKKDRHNNTYVKVTRDEFDGISESMSGSSDTFHCVHGPEGKQYTEKGRLKREFVKKLDPLTAERKWTDACTPAYGWEMANTLMFLVTDPVGRAQVDRLHTHVLDFAKITKNGYRIDQLDLLPTIIEHLVDNQNKQPQMREGLVQLLKNAEKPIRLNVNTDVITYFEHLRGFIAYLGYLLVRIEDDDQFQLVSNAVLWHLTMTDSKRGKGSAQLRHEMAAAGGVLHETVVRMLALASTKRFPTFLNVAWLLAIESNDYCMEMAKLNILENIFYRFNPYFPTRDLPQYSNDPKDLRDCNVKLGDSLLNFTTTLSLVLIVLKTIKQFLEEYPGARKLLPCPDEYSQRCFTWAYRYVCRADQRHHDRNNMTVVISALLHCFGDRLTGFSYFLFGDILSLAVKTEAPPRDDWTATVNFNTVLSLDAVFKKRLIYLSIDLLKTYKGYNFMIEARYWLLGLMYLLDPNLGYVKAKWSPALYDELQKTALQALVCVMPMADPRLAEEYGLVRRIMWYIEWYTDSPYDVSILYWSVRLIQSVAYASGSQGRKLMIKNLFNTHGIIIMMHLCDTILEQNLPPITKRQTILSVCLRLLSSTLVAGANISCCVYPHIKWPQYVNSLANRMMAQILYSLNAHLLVSERWTVSVLNFIWEAIIWNPEYRKIFVANNGIYSLLDLITMSGPSVQTIALALVIDVARAGEAVGHLVTWRANLGASSTYPQVAPRGTTIAGLLAKIFRDECIATGVRLDENGVILNMDFPLMSSDCREELVGATYKHQPTNVCLTAADIAGSRMSKAFALLSLLSEDLEYKVSLADETFNLYKNIELGVEDETILVLCSHCLTLKLMEAWGEAKVQIPGLVPEDEEILEEFLVIQSGWAKEVQRLQRAVIDKHKDKASVQETALYTFLSRVRLNISLDALRDIRCTATSADRVRHMYTMLNDAVQAHHRLSTAAGKIDADVIRTYSPPLDVINQTGQHIRIDSINAGIK